MDWFFSVDAWERPLFLFFCFFAFLPFFLRGYYSMKRGREVSNLAGIEVSKKLGSKNKPWLKSFSLCLFLIFIGFTIAGPRGNPHPHSMNIEGRDLVFVLDISRSMLAQDLKPSRLERSKIAIKECVEQLSTSRIGLVVYAGSAEVRCPLTWDHSFFMRSLDRVYPNDVKVGGTRLEDALKKTCEKVFVDNDSSFRDVILITDGEDHGSVKKVSELLHENGINLMIFGVGDPVSGARIPLDESGRQYQMYEGKIIWTKLEESMLRKIVENSEHASYLSVGTRDFDLFELYNQATRHMGSGFSGSNTVIIYDSYTHISALFALFFFLFPYIWCLCWQMLPHAVCLSIMLLLVSCSQGSHISDPEKAISVQQALDLQADSNHKEAAMEFEELLEQVRDPKLKAYVMYQLGCSYFELAKIAQNTELDHDDMMYAMEMGEEFYDAHYYLERASDTFLGIIDQPRLSKQAAYNFEMVHRYIDFISNQEEEQETQNSEPQDQESQQQMSNSEENENSEDSQESSESGEEQQSQDSKQTKNTGQFQDDGSGLPVPTDSPEDIMEQMQELQKGRKSDKAPRRDGKVEKDW